MLSAYHTKLSATFHSGGRWPLAPIYVHIDLISVAEATHVSVDLVATVLCSTDSYRPADRTSKRAIQRTKQFHDSACATNSSIAIPYLEIFAIRWVTPRGHPPNRTKNAVKLLKGVFYNLSILLATIGGSAQINQPAIWHTRNAENCRGAASGLLKVRLCAYNKLLI